MISFTVPGTSASQGSKKAYVRKGRAIVVETNTALRPWRQAVTAAAQDAMAGRQAFTGPVSVEAQFHFVRPAGHFGSGRNAGRLKASAPAYVTSHRLGDLDKHARSLGDALRDAGVVRDDSQIAILYCIKLYDDRSFAYVTVRSLEQAA